MADGKTVVLEICPYYPFMPAPASFFYCDSLELQLLKREDPGERCPNDPN